MLTERCTELNQKLTQLRQIKRLQNKAAVLNTRVSDLNGALLALQPGYEALRAMRRGGISVDLHSADSGAVAERAEQVRTELTGILKRIREDRQTLADPELLREVLPKLHSLAGQLQQATEQAWREYINQVRRMADPGTISVFGALPGMGKTVQQVRLLVWQLDRQLRALPKTDDDVQKLVEAEEDLRRAIQALNPEGISSEVRTFLLSLKGGGAPVRLLTPEVQGWVQDNGLEESLYVVTRESD